MVNADPSELCLQQSVHVGCGVEDAFRLFTEKFGEWWPLALHSMEGQDAVSCAIEPWEGGRVYERNRAGEENEWGSVTGWEPPSRLSLKWHPGSDPDEYQTVDIWFEAVADGTKVTVIHTVPSISGVANLFVSFAESQMMVAA